MKLREISDEMLMSYADGELDAVTMADIDRAAAEDKTIANRLHVFEATRAAAREAMAPMLEEPVPNRLSAAVRRMLHEPEDALPVREGSVLTFRRPDVSPGSSTRWMLPLVASLAVVLGGLGGYFTGRMSPPKSPGLGLPNVLDPALAEALATMPSGSESRLDATRQRFRVIATFVDRDRSLCREFELDSDNGSTLISVACHMAGAWRVTFGVAAAAGGEGYAPASSIEALDAYLAAIDAAPPLSPEAEAEAISALRQ